MHIHTQIADKMKGSGGEEGEGEEGDADNKDFQNAEANETSERVSTVRHHTCALKREINWRGGGKAKHFEMR